MATMPIASLVACSWCGLLAERGPVCDACGSPVSETSRRTTVLRVPEAEARFHESRRAAVQAPAPQVVQAPPIPRPDLPRLAPVQVAAPAPVAMPAQLRAPQPVRPALARQPILSDVYVAALIAEDVLPESWGFDPTREERRIFRRQRVLATLGVVLGFAGVAELIDFLMSHLH